MAEASHSDTPTHAVHINNKRMLATVPCACASTKWDKFDLDDDLDDTDSDDDSFDN